MTLLAWLSCEARTGRKITELTELRPTQPLKHTLGQAETLTCTIPTARLPREWARPTKPGGTFLVALSGVMPVYGLLLLTRHSTWNADQGSGLELGGVTIPGYLERRFVGTITYRGWGRNAVVADLVARFVVPNGIPLRVVQHGGSGPLVTRVYLDSDDRTVASAIEDLCGVDGAQWTVEWEVTPGPTPTYTPVLHIGTIGDDPRTRGLQPVTFEVPSGSATADLLESFEDGIGANVVTATGQKSGDVRLQRTRQDLSDTDLPIFELRDQVTAGDDDPDGDVTLADLDAHAAAVLAVVGRGGSTISFTSDVASAPRLGDGTDGTWRAGNIIAVTAQTRPTEPGHYPAPGKYTAPALQCIGWEWDTNANPETITPVLYVPSVTS